jgi:uncharacterized repeat protein (TIGR01451 family)
VIVFERKIREILTIQREMIINFSSLISSQLTNFNREQERIFYVLFAFIFFFAINTVAQTNPDLEMAGPASANGLVYTYTVPLQKNTNNPSGNTFAAYASPSALNVTFAVTQQTYSGNNPYNNQPGSLFFGDVAYWYGANRTAYTLMNDFGNASTPNADFTSSGATAGTGIDVAANYGVRVVAAVGSLDYKRANGRYKMGEITISFSRPVNNPLLHLKNLGGTGTPVSFTAEFTVKSILNQTGVDILSASPMSLVSGTNLTVDNTTKHIDNSYTGTADNGATNSGRGTVLFAGNAISSIVLEVYVNGNGSEYDNYWAANNADAFIMSATVAESDLSITKTVDNNKPVPGSNVTFNLTAKNNGASNNAGVKVTDLLPSGYTYVNSNPSTGTTYNSSTGVWDIGNMADGSQVALSITATVKTDGVFNNIARISSTSGISDPVSTNDVAMAVVNIDSDGDGVPDKDDLDDDNDGILDSAEGCGASVVMGTVSSTLATDLQNNKTAIFPLVPPGAILPNGGVKLTVTSTPQTYWGVYTPPASTGTLNINGQSVSFSTTYLDMVGWDNFPRTFDMDFGITSYNLGSVGKKYRYIVGVAGQGGEGVTANDIFSVPLEVIGNVNSFNSGVYSNLDGVPSTTPGMTGTIISTNTNTVQGYTFYYLPEDVSKVTVQLTGKDPHGLIFGVYNSDCGADKDGDGISNQLDLDSDGDACYDAIEGDENVLPSQLNANGSINIATTGGVDANGVPKLVNSGGTADLGGDQGQGIGTSQNASLKETASITTQPLASQALCPNATPTYLNVVAAGSPVLTYQWYSNTINSTSGGTLISGATSDKYTPVTSNSGTLYYYVIVTGSCGSATSNVATVIVNPLPTAYSVTGGGSYCAGGSGKSVDLSGSQSGVNYQLQLNGANSGASVAGTGSTISFGNQISAGTYTVTATNSSTGCSVNMDGSATIAINSLPATPTVSNSIVSNTCPSSTVNIAILVTSPKPSDCSLLYKTTNDPTGADVADPTTVGAGIYYIFYKNTSGCSSFSATPVTVTIHSCNDLSITKAVSPMDPLVGTDVTFTITAFNGSTQAVTATEVKVTDKLLPNYEFKSYTVTTGAYDNAKGIWTIGNLAPNTSAVLTIIATVK